MAAASGTVYQQMIVPSPYNYHSQPIINRGNQEHQVNEQKKESKKKRKVSNANVENNGGKKVNSNLGSNSLMNNGRLLSKNDCSRCNTRRKCFKHLSQK